MEDAQLIILIDHMGNDSSIVQAARVSTGQGTKTPEQDDKLIGYLMKHEHWTPFEMPVYKFYVKTPIFVARQWFRHRMGSFNERSGRYTEFETEFYSPSNLKYQSKSNKQGSDADMPEVLNRELLTEIAKLNEQSSSLYKRLLDAGVSKEQARIILPVSIYTEFYWQVNLRSLFNFIKLRNDKGAQEEIRECAVILEEIVKEKNPIAYKYFAEYHRK